MKKELVLLLLSVRFYGGFVLGGVHFPLQIEADMEVLQFLGKFFNDSQGISKGQKFDG